MHDLFSSKQLKFILESTKKINIAHGSVRAGKTVCSMFRFLESCYNCPDSQLWMIGKTSDSIYDNAVRLIFEMPALAEFKPFCTWHPGARELRYKDKTIGTLGAKDEGSLGVIMGKTMSCLYCDEITFYPDNIILGLATRLSMPHSQMFATCNPSYPDHLINQWIEKAKEGDKDYYQLHFTLKDTPFVDESYKSFVKNSMTGLTFRRLYLGEWCLAEGAIFDFFDRKLHVIDREPAAEYWIAGIDYGMNHPTACLVVGVNTGRYTQTGRKLWVQDEYFWNPKDEHRGRQKTIGELARDIKEFIEPYAITNIYIDPSAEALQREFSRLGMKVTHANNDVFEGITYMTSEMAKGNLYVMANCKETIRSIERYSWDDKAAKKGEDKPLKSQDDAVDALRYAIYSHKVPDWKQQQTRHDPEEYKRNQFNPGVRRKF